MYILYLLTQIYDQYINIVYSIVLGKFPKFLTVSVKVLFLVKTYLHVDGSAVDGLSVKQT